MEIIVIEKTQSNRPFECCINSVNYRIERGVPVSVPREVAEMYRTNRIERLKSANRLEAFSKADGMKL